MVLEKVYRSVILILIPFLALSFGGVQKWTTVTMELILFSLIALWGINSLSKKDSFQSSKRKDSFLYLLLLPFIFIPLAQIVPLSSELLKLISPGLFIIKESAGINDNINFPGHISVNPYETLSSLKLLISCFFSFILTAILFNKKERLKVAIYFLLALSFILSFFGVVQYFSWNGKLFWFKPITVGAPFGPFVNHNHFASFINLTILPLLSLLLYQFRRGIRYNLLERRETLFLIFSLSLTICALLLSGSRGGIVSFLAGISFMIFILWKEGEYKKKAFILSLTLSIVSLLLVLVESESVFNTLSTLYSVSDDPSLLYRLKGWKASLDIIMDYPFLGTGLGTYRDIFLLYRPFDMERTFHYAHNEYIQLLVETGVVGFFMLSIPFFVLFIKLNPIQAVDKDREKRYLQAGLYSAIFIMLIHNVVEFNMHIPSNAYLFSIICGLYVAITGKGIKPGRKSITTILIISILLLFISCVEGLRILKYENSMKSSKSLNTSNILTWLPGDPHSMIENVRRLINKGNNDAAVYEVINAINAAPLRAHYWVFMSEVLTLTGNKDESINSLKIATVLDPVNPVYKLNLARVAFDEGHHAEAVKILKKMPINRSDHFYSVVKLMIEKNVNSIEVMEMAKRSSDMMTIANLLNTKGDSRGTLSAYRKAIELEPENERAINLYANYLIKMKDIDSLKNMDQLFSGNVPERAVYWKSQAFILNGEIDTAINLLDFLIKRSRNNVNMYGEELAFLYFKNGNYDEAVKVSEMVLKQNKRSIKAYNVLGTTYEKVGKLLEAIKIYKRLSIISPSDFNVHYKLSLLYEKAGIMQMAIKELESCLDIQPDNINIRLKLGDVFVSLGRNGEAFKQYQTVLTLDSSNMAVISRIKKMNH